MESSSRVTIVHDDARMPSVLRAKYEQMPDGLLIRHIEELRALSGYEEDQQIAEQVAQQRGLRLPSEHIVD